MCKVSIIVPVYNSSNCLKKCLESLINQTLKDIEIIMVNDGSTDNSKDIILKYQKKDKRIILINKKNGGQASARNVGLKHAKGEYISFVDSDDYVDKNMCKDALNTMIKSDCDILVFDYFVTDYKNTNYYKVLKELSTGNINNKQFFFASACPWNKIYKKTFLLDNKFSFPEGMIYEDYAAIIPLIKYNPRIFYINKAYYYYYLSNESKIRKKEYNKKYEDIFKANEILLNILKDTEYTEELEYMVAYHMLYEGSLNFYKYNKLENIDKISDFIKRNFKKWYKNKYVVKELNLKSKLLMKLFYYKKYNIIMFFQRIKRLIINK